MTQPRGHCPPAPQLVSPARQDYLTRELDPSDRRSFRLPLTPDGQAAAARVLSAIADLERHALAGLSADQMAGYHAVITALQEAS
jgi:MarR family transcriptional regulator, organic hydroperoxide resistance regulator